MPSHIVVLDGKSYTWDGKSWYGTNDYMSPPEHINQKLNAKLTPLVADEDALISDRDELVSRAQAAVEARQLERAERLARRAYDLAQSNYGTAAVLSKILRVKGRPEEALKIADQHVRSNYPPVLTSRAAALCDLGRWNDALYQIRQVLAIVRQSRKHGAEEAFAVHARIKANASHLFSV